MFIKIKECSSKYSCLPGENLFIYYFQIVKKLKLDHHLKIDSNLKTTNDIKDCL